MCYCSFAGNNAQAGGGLFELDVEGTVDQCAFEDNVGSSSDQSFGSGGGLSQSGGSGNVSNSIFVSNMVRKCFAFNASPSRLHHVSLDL